jgi:hypothetical protein
MATPSVFVSSTFYDLRHIRERLGYFIRSLGYTAVLSEDGAVYYNPGGTAAEGCTTEVANCQMLVLVIGGRYGSEYPESQHSVTNAEYKEASQLRIPVFALVEQGAYGDYQLFRANKNQDGVDLAALTFPNVDDLRVFDFIDEVQSSAVNNALVPFRDYADIESYLRQQWAGMLHSYLVGTSEERRTQDMLSVITSMNRRIELLSTRILESVGTDREKALAVIYSRMLKSRAVSDLRYIGAICTPASILEHPTIDAHARTVGKEWLPSDEGGFMISSSAEISRIRFEAVAAEYIELRAAVQNIARESGLTPADLAALHELDTDPVLLD